MAAGLQRSPLPSPADSLPLFLLYTLLPAPRSSPPSTSKDADPRPAKYVPPPHLVQTSHFPSSPFLPTLPHI